jgi:hypothetical protein
MCLAELWQSRTWPHQAQQVRNWLFNISALIQNFGGSCIHSLYFFLKITKKLVEQQQLVAPAFEEGSMSIHWN